MLWLPTADAYRMLPTGLVHIHSGKRFTLYDRAKLTKILDILMQHIESGKKIPLKHVFRGPTGYMEMTHIIPVLKYYEYVVPTGYHVDSGTLSIVYDIKKP